MSADLLRGALHAYPLVSGIGIVGTLVLLVAHRLLGRPHSGEPRERPNLVASTAWLLTASSVVLLAGTALGPLWLGSRMHGGLVLAHVAAGGVAGIALAGLALIGAAASRPSRPATAVRDDQGGLDRGPPDSRHATIRPWHGFARSFAFHCILLLGLAALLSALAPMYGWVGAPESEVLLDLHRWAGLGLVIAVGAHAALRRRRPGHEG